MINPDEEERQAAGALCQPFEGRDPLGQRRPRRRARRRQLAPGRRLRLPPPGDPSWTGLDGRLPDLEDPLIRPIRTLPPRRLVRVELRSGRENAIELNSPRSPSRKMAKPGYDTMYIW